jgi:hypothetical protein
MSDLKTVLAETLREALASEHPFNGGTFPRWFRVWINEASENAADALLGIPGVAVTQLPEPAVNLSAEYEDDVTHAWEWDEDSFLALDSDGVAGGTHLLDSRPVEELVPLARAILAAAVVLSEGETR